MRRSLLVFVTLCCSYTLYAQKPMSIQIKDPVICYASTENHRHHVPAPTEYLKKRSNKSNVTSSTSIIVNYVGFEDVPQAQAAFQRAVDIWEDILITSVPIHIEARWVSLNPGVLGSANYTSAYANFKGAQKINVFYPVAIAEKITGRELNEGSPDIFANFNKNFDWHFDPDDANIPEDKYDLTTVVLHEIGHGLGFSGTFTTTNTRGFYGLAGTDVPIVYDAFLENGTQANLISNFRTSSTLLKAELTSSNLFFNGNSEAIKIYAPSTFDPGSSISHVDEDFFDNTPDALMTPMIAPQERVHAPGIALNMLNDLGWEMVYINHFQLPDNENINGPYTVTATLSADRGYDPESVKLNYILNGTNFTRVTMTSQGDNVFRANIPGTGIARLYGYYISAENEDGVEFVNPGKGVSAMNPEQQFLYIFASGPDTEKPIITHTQKIYLLNSETELVVNAKISDNSGSVEAVLEYSINGEEQDDLMLMLTSPEEDSIYTATINFSELVNGDEIKYRIIATDNSSSHNKTISPKEDYYIVPIIGFEAAQTTYQTTFGDPDRDQEFFGLGFNISRPEGFNNRAMHSEHPYTSGAGFANDERDLIYQLRIPIIVANADALIRFDEIALIEPGASGSVFGDSDFYDYVIVEGSIDEGQTWEHLAPGYDARVNSSWLSKYNSDVDNDGNSLAVATPDLYKSRQINLLNTFEAGDEVLLRFRLYSDEFATGWGWSIDNLAIQTVITKTEDAIESSITVYPNPTKEIITVEAFDQTSPYTTIALLSTQGQEMYHAVETAVTGKVAHTIGVKDLPAGMYLLKISNDGKSITRKVIKQN